MQDFISSRRTMCSRWAAFDIGAAARARIWTAVLAGFMALSVGACGGGGGGGGPGGDTGNGDDEPVEPTLASIQANVFSPICTQCHTGASAPEGLRLEAGLSYGMLVNVASSEVPSLLRVDPGNPDDSYLVHKIEGTAAVGARMPLGLSPLSPDTIAAIRQWITDGALEMSSAATMPATKTGLVAAWPMADSALAEAPARIILIADGELDASLLHAESVHVIRLDDINPATLEPRRVMNLELRLTSLAPTVITLRAPQGEWIPGRYEVRVKGSGATPVGDRAGHIIDGDGDGKPGGDFVLRFRIGNE